MPLLIIGDITIVGITVFDPAAIPVDEEVPPLFLRRATELASVLNSISAPLLALAAAAKSATT
jgi:hypothetical protein